MSSADTNGSDVKTVRGDDCAQEYVDQAMVLWIQYQENWEENLLHRVIALEREALGLRPAGHPDRDVFCNNLAISLLTLSECSGDESFLAECIDLNREALRLRPEGHPYRSNSCTNLASALWTAQKRSGDEHLLIESIDLNRGALGLHSDGDPYRATFCINLALSLRTLYNYSGDEGLLTECIQLVREALRLHPAGHPDRHHSCSNLSSLLRTLYKCSRNEALLDESIDMEREALRLRPLGHRDRFTSCGNLALSLRALYKRSGDESVLTECIDLEREALRLCSPGHPNRFTSCNNLASSLQTLYQCSGDKHLLTQAVDLYREGAALAPEHEKWYSTIELSFIHLVKDYTHYNVGIAIQYLSLSLETEPNNVLYAVSQALVALDKIWLHMSKGASYITTVALVIVYQRIIALLPLLTSPVLDLASQLQRLRDVSKVGADAFVNAALAGHWRTGLEHLEVAQGLIWAQRLHQRDPQLRAVPGILKAELEKCLQQLARRQAIALVGQPSLSRDELHRHSSRMYTVIRQIRAVPGLERFMLGESYETLCSVAAHHPVVVLVGARGHFYAFIIHRGQFQDNGPLRLEVTEDILDLTSIHGKLSSHRGAPACEMNENNDRAMRINAKLIPLDHYLEFLWLRIVKPILEVLQLQPSSSLSRPRLHWCPTGPFTTMPLHAAGIYGERAHRKECCADYVVSSYTPTLTTLLRVQCDMRPLAKADLALLLIAEKRARESLALIPGVDDEINHIAAISAAHNVRIVDYVVGSTSVARTSETVKRANMTHLACHGVQDPTDATRSGFCLGDGRLTISELSDMDLKSGFLAFLSACETAKGSDEQPDQAMHLAAAMLFVGFKSVIATMWAISDEDGPIIAKWFYEELFANEVIDAGKVAYALDSAVGKLRELGVPSHRWVPFIHMGA